MRVGGFLKARGIKKPKLKLPLLILTPIAAVTETLQTNPMFTSDEITTLQMPNLADGIDSVSVHFGWRPTRPSEWVPQNWKAPGR
jgi:hypothetical protein